MSLPYSNEPSFVRTWAFRACLTAGLANIIAGTAGIAYCAATLGFDLRDWGAVIWAAILAVCGGAGVLPGILFCALAARVRRGRRVASITLLAIAGMHACVVLWLVARLVTSLESNFRYNPGAAWVQVFDLLVTGAVLLADVAMLVLVFWSVRERSWRTPIGHAFEPVMQALAPGSAAPQPPLARKAESRSAPSGPVDLR
jgi:hypothetical protein